jgi:type IV secretory pathway VirB2 component (pilin)
MRKVWMRIPFLWTVLFLTNSALAAVGQTGLPWEAPLQKLQSSISGPVAVLIGIIALAAIGVTLIFGGEWNEFARRGVFAVCAIALLVGGTVIMTTLFGVSAACV